MLRSIRGLDQLILLLDQSRYSEAETLARQFITTSPEIDAYKYCLAQALMLQGKLDQADSVADALLRDCLLYTSPSPRDQRGSRMPSSA